MGSITVTREVHPQEQDQSVNASNSVNRILGQTYTSAKGVGMIECRHGAGGSATGGNEMWRSEDNGRSWSLQEVIPSRVEIGGGLNLLVSVSAFYLDCDHDLLVRFIVKEIVRDAAFGPWTTYDEMVGTHVPNTVRCFYQVSSDAGLSWTEERQLIQKGSEYDEKHWAKDITYEKSWLGVYAPSLYPKLADGTIVVSFYAGTGVEEDTFGTVQTGCLRARWTADVADIEWDMGGKVYGGGCEQTTALLNDGRILNIFRTQGLIEPYVFSEWLRPFSLSEDGGKTWTRPRPLGYTDGSSFTSPRAFSQLIRSAKNGKLYWIANILPALDDPSSQFVERHPGRATPRHPLQIAEVDEQNIAIKKETVTVIEDREPGETHWVGFSNYRTYNDRETGEIIVLMTKAYSELQENRMKLPHPHYRYRIALPD